MQIWFVVITSYLFSKHTTLSRGIFEYLSKHQNFDSQRPMIRCYKKIWSVCQVFCISFIQYLLKSSTSKKMLMVQYKFYVMTLGVFDFELLILWTNAFWSFHSILIATWKRHSFNLLLWQLKNGTNALFWKYFYLIIFNIIFCGKNKKTITKI